MTALVRPVDVSELRAFCTAVDLGSLGRAARALRVSQPAVSKRMRELEALAGTRLLERSPRGIVPTPAGLRLYAEARKLLVQAERVDEVVLSLAGDEAPVRLAVSHTIAEFVLPGPLVEYEQAHARHLSLELVIANSTVVRELVRDGRADFGIAAAEPVPDAGERMEQLELLADEVVVAVPPEHPWARLREIPVDALVATPMVMRDPSANTRRVVEAVLAERGLALVAPLAEVGSTSAAKAAAISERAPVLLSRLALGAGESLVTRPVAGIRFPRRFAILFVARAALPGAARSLMDHLVASIS